MGFLALFLLAGATVCMGGRRRTIIQTTMSMLRHVKRKAGPNAKVTPTRACIPASPETPRNTPFAMKDVSLVGPGAEDAVRYLAMDTLLDRHSYAAELVLSLSDAWRLFGMDVGTLQNDRIPGLVLTDDFDQMCFYLAHRGASRRLVITYESGVEEFRELGAHQHGELTIISLAPPTTASAEVSADGEVTPCTADPTLHGRLPLLSESDAFNRLMSLPTLAQQPFRIQRVSTTQSRP